eukprot:5914930-Prymnesium_polylepis.2
MIDTASQAGGVHPVPRPPGGRCLWSRVAVAPARNGALLCSVASAFHVARRVVQQRDLLWCGPGHPSAPCAHSGVTLPQRWLALGRRSARGV